MRCSCRVCGVYMVQAEDDKMGCVCPECFNRCTDCLGTNSVITQDLLREMRNNPAIAEMFIMNREEDSE